MRRSAILVCVVTVLHLSSGGAQAGTFTLNQSACTLSAAAAAINQQVSNSACGYFVGGADTVSVPSGAFVSGSQVEFNRAVTIKGGGVGVSTLRGNIASDYYFIRMVDPTLSNWFSATVQDVTIDRTNGGSTTNGLYADHVTLNVNRTRITGFGFGGIGAYDANVFATDCTIDNNSSPGGGGGIWFSDEDSANCATLNTDLIVKRSTISNNGANNAGGGIYYEGCGNSVIYNTTISDNTATDGGGIGQAAGQYLFVEGSTIAFNRAFNSGGGVVVQGLYGIKLEGTIVGQNSAPSGPDIWGEVNDFTDSMIGNTAGTTNWLRVAAGVTFHDRSPMLDSNLLDLGGPNHTKVHRPLPGSPVIDAVPGPAAPSWADGGTDQRQVLRPQLGGSNASNSDMGAFESSRLETEVLPVAQKSGVNHVVVTASQASAGKGTNLQTNATGQFVTYSSGALLPAGNYGVKIGFKKGTTAGQFQFSAGPSTSGPWINFAVQNARAGADSWVTVDFGTITAQTSSTKFFRFMVPGGAASPFQIFPDFVEFTRK